ncbi:MAG: lactonase family protein [Acidobacteriota bacterium]
MKRRTYLKAGLKAGLAAIGAQSLGAWASADSGEYLVYFGTYTDLAARGIYAYRFQPSTGKLTSIGLVATTPNPAFLVATPNGRFLYAVNWKGDEREKQGDTVIAYAIDRKTGKLTFLNKVDSKGEMPTNLATDHSGKTLLVVSYTGGNIVGYQIEPDGKLSAPTAYFEHRGKSVHPVNGPHSHGVIVSPDNKHAFVGEVGLDQVRSYSLDAAKGKLTPSDPPFVSVTPGTAPRHLAFHPSGKYLYVNDESRPAVTVFAVDGGHLKEIQEVPAIPADFKGRDATAEIQIDQKGRFVYVSNRGHDSIAVFSVDQATGKITPVQYASSLGKTPRNFSLDPTGEYLFAANQNSDTVVPFKVDPETGKLTPTGEPISVPKPVCVLFVKAQ